MRRQNNAGKVKGRRVDHIIGIRDGRSERQAIRYPLSAGWNGKDATKQARNHCNNRGGSFEQARNQENTMADELRWQGVIAIEGEPTGDGRMMEEGSLRWDGGTWPLLWSRSDGGHQASVVGYADEIWRDGNLIKAAGHLSDSEDDQAQADVTRVSELLREGAVGTSVALDDETAEIRVERQAIDKGETPDDESAGGEEVDDEDRIVVMRFRAGEEMQVTTDARIRHIAVVDTPAFAESEIAMADDEGMAAVGAHPRARIAAVEPGDSEAFANPQFGGDNDDRLVRQEPERQGESVTYGCPLVVTDDGHVYGHAALWGRCHAGFASQCVAPPREGNYDRFLTGEAIPGVRTGPLTVGTTHADLTVSGDEAMRHYSDTGRAVADVTVGEDDYGIWVAGKLRPTATSDDVAELRGSSLSGDWRPIGGRLRLVGILAVNQPGFMVQRQASEEAVAAAITAGPCCADDPLVAQVDIGGNVAMVALLPTESEMERLSVAGGLEPQDVCVKLAVLGDADDVSDSQRDDILESANQAAGELSAGTQHAFGYAVLDPREERGSSAAVLLVEGELVVDARDRFAELDTSADPLWLPHVTVADPEQLDRTVADALSDKTGDVVFDRLRVMFGNETTDYPLAGADDLTASGVSKAEHRALQQRLHALEVLAGDWLARDVKDRARSAD
jgi:hypothetical protein